MAMHSSAAAGWLLTAVCAVPGFVCLLRARSAESAARSAAGSEALMGLAMAAMALPLPPPLSLPPVLLAPVFCAAGAWELLLLLRQRHPSGAAAHRLHHLHHLLGAAVMTGLALVTSLPHTGDVRTAGPGSLPEASARVLTAALLVYFAGYVLVSGARLLYLQGAAEAVSPPEPSGLRGRPAIHRTPGLAAACRLAMGTGMFAMLLTA